MLRDADTDSDGARSAVQIAREPSGNEDEGTGLASHLFNELSYRAQLADRVEEVPKER
jgi:hypothetical protein